MLGDIGTSIARPVYCYLCDLFVVAYLPAICFLLTNRLLYVCQVWQVDKARQNIVIPIPTRIPRKSTFFFVLLTASAATTWPA